MDFSRLRTGEIVAAASGLALFIFMFFNWFGGGVEISTGGSQDVPGIGEIPSEPTVEQTGVSAWDSLQDFSGFLIALAAIGGITLGALAAAGQRLNLPFQRGIGTLVLGDLAVLLILWRILANPGDLKIGIFLGLIAAAGIAAGAWITLREDGFEPLVTVPGGPTKVASASAPAATPTPRPASAPGGASAGGSSSSGSRSGKSTTAKSRSSGGKSTAKKAPAKKKNKKSTASRSKSSSASKSKARGSSRSKSSGSSRPKSKSSSRSKGAGSSRSKSGGSKPSRSRSSGTKRRSSGGRK